MKNISNRLTLTINIMYIKTEARFKQASRYKQVNVIKDNGKYLKTCHVLYHKRLAVNRNPNTIKLIF